MDPSLSKALSDFSYKVAWAKNTTFGKVEVVTVYSQTIAEVN